MDKNLKGNLIIINVSEIIHVLLRWVWLAVLAGGACAAVLGMYAASMAASNVPMYKTTTKLYITEMSIPDYMEMVESRPVLETVISELGLNMSHSELKGCISDNTPAGTSTLWLSVVFPDPEWAKAVADELVVVSASYALDIMGGAPPVVYEEASVPTRAYNTVYASATKYGVIGFVAGFILVCGLVFVWYFLKNRFDTPSKVEDRLRVKLLAFIARNKKGKEQPDMVRACRHFVSRMHSEGVAAEILSFVSVSDTEGRTELVSGFAECLEEFGKKVVYIDMTSEVIAAEEQSKPGLNDYLSGKCSLEELVSENKDSADKISVGTNVGLVCELYASNEFENLLQELKNKYDYVLINVPAMENHMEAELITKKTEATVIALSSKGSNIFKTKKLVKNLDKQSINVLGAVLTDVKVQKNRYFKKTYKMFLEG